MPGSPEPGGHQDGMANAQDLLESVTQSVTQVLNQFRQDNRQALDEFRQEVRRDNEQTLVKFLDKMSGQRCPFSDMIWVQDLHTLTAELVIG